ncbi:hypothetical protein [Embleya sp. NBC_00896]|uniref:hypothetical protein n=1 Tax=Embleya sp. NBC_00896 TaxID=2975961 RepID=UPI0038646F22|nr:hypothetical protein OG928_00575 [Embleya sp. NBC_00896]
MAAADDLIADLERGRLPFPRCPAEHHGLAVADAEATLDEDPDLVADEAAGLPADPTDYQWNACRRYLLTTCRTPDEDPQRWFAPFPDVEPRRP